MKRIVILSLLQFFLVISTVFAQSRAMTLEDVMQFKSLSSQQISSDGKWVVASAWPDRGDGYVLVQQVEGRKSYTIELAKNPIISSNGNWVAMQSTHPFKDLLEAETKKETLHNGMILLNTDAGDTLAKKEIKEFSFSNDSKWLAVLHHEKLVTDSLASNKSKSGEKGSDLEMLNLGNLYSTLLSDVKEYSIDSTSTYLVFSRFEVADSSNTLNYIDLNDSKQESVRIIADSLSEFSNITWDLHNNRLAFIQTSKSDDDVNTKSNLLIWDFKSSSLSTVLNDEQMTKYQVPIRNDIAFKNKGTHLFFGVKPQSGKKETEKDSTDIDPYDFEAILKDVELDVWHGDDPRIKTNEKVVWRQQQNQSQLSVFHVDENRWVLLADETLSNVSMPDNSKIALALDNTPYLRASTWTGGGSFDVYTINLEDGKKTLQLKNNTSNVDVSPNGEFLVFYNDKNWHVQSVNSQTNRNLTENIGVPFSDEDHDSPSEPGGYGIAGWSEDGQKVMINDKFDIWSFDLISGSATNLTLNGRDTKNQYRFQFEDRNDRILSTGENVLVHSFNDNHKGTGFYEFTFGKTGVKKMVEGDVRYRFIAKASKADVILYSREGYNEFPDLWTTSTQFKKHSKSTNLNKQLEDFAWGESSLVEWSSMDGQPVQGVLIKPGNYEPGKKYPIIVYFYELFSQRLNEFNPQLVNHRPSFPFYASNGYAIFLPDVRYTEGLPGYSAIKYIVPGVQKLIDMGIADPEAIGLHGHSWSGYQAAHMITMTDMFAAVVSGAPVSNMTSAYNGIRWGTGLARQFQYEKTQSRLGKTLWERPDLYIENSPVFYADRINTPILIQFGDEDDAVPWYQGIELYLALRRLDKDVIFLQYHGEPHHLQKYANKLDYSIRMKEYFDHYLKGYTAPKWISEGVPYSGN
ncbi:MAG TPA: S9 family peptidase [Bacteroidetes bacterium]|nr:S9 family peptidase [Bacteroidota bacterium]